MGGGSSRPGAAAGISIGKRQLGAAKGRLLQQASSRVPVGVGVNALRATLGIRPLPVSVAGAVRGVLHCTGELHCSVCLQFGQHSQMTCVGCSVVPYVWLCNCAGSDCFGHETLEQLMHANSCATNLL